MGNKKAKYLAKYLALFFASVVWAWVNSIRKNINNWKIFIFHLNLCLSSKVLSLFQLLIFFLMELTQSRSSLSWKTSINSFFSYYFQINNRKTIAKQKHETQSEERRSETKRRHKWLSKRLSQLLWWSWEKLFSFQSVIGWLK